MADIDLPVFSFRCDWQEAFTERLSWLTGIMVAEQGAEQARSLRLTPRRSFEVDILLQGPERTFWDLFVDRLGAGEVTVPLYWEVVGLTAATVAGVTNRINFDTTYREWEGTGLAILMGATALDNEIVEVAGVDAGGIDLSNTTVKAWPAGTKLVPLRRGIIEETGEPTALTAGIFYVSCRLALTVPNPWIPAADASPVYAGLPVFLEEPNWVEPLSTSYDRDLRIMDSETGKLFRADPSGRVTLGQSHRWFLDGRERLASFRDLVYRHRGRAGLFWLPTFKHDARLVNSPGSGATSIQIDKIGFDYIGGPDSGREYIAIKHAAGTLVRKILTVTPGPGASRETLGLDAPLGLALSPGQVRRISFVDVARFDQDDFEITHHGGVDALHEVSAVFRTVVNTRTAPALIDYPIPDTDKILTPCGEYDPCYSPPPYDGWDLKVRQIVYDLMGGAELVEKGTGQPVFNFTLFRPSGGDSSIGNAIPCTDDDSGSRISDCPYGSAALNQIAREFRFQSCPFGIDEISFRAQHQYGFDTIGDYTFIRFEYRFWYMDDWLPLNGWTGSGTAGGNGDHPKLDAPGPRNNYWSP